MINTYRLKFTISVAVAIAFAGIISSGYFGVGRDWYNYVRIFFDINSQIDIWTMRYEPLFKLYVKTFTSNRTPPELTYFIVIAPALVIKLMAVRNIRGDCLIFLIVYGSLWASTFEFNQIRVAMALAVLFFGISLYGQHVILPTVLATCAVGFHYSSASFIPIVWLVALLRSKMSPLRKIPLAITISALAYYSFILINSKFLPYMSDMSASRSSEGDRAFSLFSLYNIACVATILTYTIKRGFSSTPIPILIGLLASILGIFGFFIQVSMGEAYAYRILETMTAPVPFIIAWEWREANTRRKRFVILLLVLFSVALAPRYWASRLS